MWKRKRRWKRGKWRSDMSRRERRENEDEKCRRKFDVGDVGEK